MVPVQEKVITRVPTVVKKRTVVPTVNTVTEMVEKVRRCLNVKKTKIFFLRSLGSNKRLRQ